MTISAFLISFNVNASCVGKMVNPITDICWSCLFPVTMGPISVKMDNRRDTKNTSKVLCACPKERQGIMKAVPGIPLGFWEPARLIDVTRTPYCMVSMGFKMPASSNRRGTVASKGSHDSSRRSFYHVHWYIYPITYWLEILTDILCLEKTSIDLAYITELDPLWSNDELSFILNPESVLFGNPIAQTACIADCASATVSFPRDELFWCQGCQGSLYPFSGSIPTHNGGVQASQLAAGRLIAKLHRQLMLWNTSGTSNEEICKKRIAPKIKKSQYKLQMIYPIPDAKGKLACNPLGFQTFLSERGKEFPYKGEDFGYLVFRKKNCCLL